jgi:hypothetical protein
LRRAGSATRYWAADVTNVVAPTPDPACVADWDSTAYTSMVPHCLRRVDENLKYPDDLVGEVHFDGQIWSRALWDIRGALGNVRADTVISRRSSTSPARRCRTSRGGRSTRRSRSTGRLRRAPFEPAFQARGIL